MKHTPQEHQRLRRQKLAELRHQLRYTSDSREREYLAMQIDAVRRHS